MAASLSDARLSLLSPLVPAATSSAETGHSLTVNVQWDRILEDLLRLGTLEEDWDGQGAQPLDPGNVDRAVRWVKDMRRWRRAVPPTAVVPGTTGEVVLEWRDEPYYLAAEISTPSRVEWLLNLPGQPMKQWETDAGSTWIVDADGP